MKPDDLDAPNAWAAHVNYGPPGILLTLQCKRDSSRSASVLFTPTEARAVAAALLAAAGKADS